MGFILQLTDGTDTIDFMEEAFQVEDGGLQISPPEEVQTWTDPSAEGGKRLVDSRQGNRTITVTFHIAGTTRLEIRQGINLINAILRKAIQHSLGKGSERVTFKYAWDEVDVVDNFEVFSGKLILPDDMLSVEKIHTQWGANFRLRGCQLELVVSPNAYGLSPSTDDLIELPLTNRNGTNVLGGLLVKTFTDLRPGYTYYGQYVDNYVEIKGSDILGDSPAKVRIEIMEIGSASKLDRVVIGAHEKHAGQLFFHWADPNVEIFSSGTSRQTDYTLGGSVWRSTSLYPSYSGRFLRVKLSNPEVYGSKKYRVFMSTGFFPFFVPTSVPMQMTVNTASGITLYQGPVVQQYTSSSGRAMILDLGVVQIPPYSPKMPDPQDVYLQLNLLGGAKYDFTMSIGHLWLVPVDSGYRFLALQQGLAEYIPSYPTIVEDYWQDLTYLTSSIPGTGSISAVQAMYAPITLNPGKDHRIYFNFYGHNYIPQMGYSYNVRVFYSPSYIGAV